MDRDAVIATYRHLRAIAVKHNSGVLRHVSRPGWMEQARRLGLLMGKNTIVAGSEDEMTLIFDLAIYSPRQGRPRPIELYRRAARLAPDSDEARVLDAMCAARFAICRVEAWHESAGVVVRDLLRDAELWLMDLGMEATADEGACFASHLITPDAYSMTTGVVVPVDRDILEDALDDMPPARHASPDVMAADPLFATLVYRAALLDGAMERIAFA
jgi:hypothetical protein